VTVSLRSISFEDDTTVILSGFLSDSVPIDVRVDYASFDAEVWKLSHRDGNDLRYAMQLFFERLLVARRAAGCR
jgi:hypothetical protein